MNRLDRLYLDDDRLIDNQVGAEAFPPCLCASVRAIRLRFRLSQRHKGTEGFHVSSECSIDDASDPVFHEFVAKIEQVAKLQIG